MTPHKLFNKNFVLLFQAQLVSRIGNTVFRMSVILWLKQLTESPTVIGFFFLSLTLPIILFGPLAGVLVDRVSRKHIIVYGDLIVAICMLCVFFVIDFSSSTEFIIVLLYFCALTVSTVESVFRPAVNAIVPDIVPDNKIEKANGFVQNSLQISLLTGQFFGSVLFGILGAPILIFANGLGYLLSSITESFMLIPKRKNIHKQRLGKTLNVYKKELAEGFFYSVNKPGLGLLLLVAAISEFFIAPCAVLLPFLVEDVLKESSAWYGLLLMGMALGVIVGNLLPGILKFSPIYKGKIVIFGMIFISVSLVAISYSENIVNVLVILMLLGVCVGMNNILIMSVIQRSTSRELRGRIFGIYTTLRFALTPVSMGFAGIVADLLDKDIARLFFWSGLVSMLVCPVLIINRGFTDLMSYRKSQNIGCATRETISH